MSEIIFQKKSKARCFGSEKSTRNITCEYMNIKVFSPALEA